MTTAGNQKRRISVISSSGRSSQMDDKYAGRCVKKAHMVMCSPLTSLEGNAMGSAPIKKQIWAQILDKKKASRANSSKVQQLPEL